MNRRQFLAGAAALACGCRDDGPKFYATPNGYPFAWENVGSVPGWFGWDDITNWFDVAVEEACAYLARYGVLPDVVRNIARSHKHYGVDMPRFAIGASPTGWASGAYFQGARTIQLAFWSRVSGDVVPPDAPPWTAYTWPTRPVPAYDWGAVPRAFPALGHEYGHALYGPTFEHTWVPPIINGAQLLGAVDWSDRCAVLP